MSEVENQSSAIVVLVTAPSQEVARQLAKTLLDKKIIACANLFPVSSLYRWEGKICEDDEICLVLKTKADLFHSELVPAIQAIHPYQVPEIIALPLTMGAASYLAWIDESCSRDAES